MRVLDTRGRPLRDLRISVTDRCNMRCRYCMPREVFGADFPYLPRADVLTYEEIDRLVGLFVTLGVEKIRLTGGEPLLRKDLSTLVSMLSMHGAEIAMTTNGVLLPRYAPALSAAGLDRVTVSLDAIDEATFAEITDSGHTVAAVLAGIEAAESVGLGPISQRRRDPTLGRAFLQPGHRRSLHRIHGCGHHQWLGDGGRCPDLGSEGEIGIAASSILDASRRGGQALHP